MAMQFYTSSEIRKMFRISAVTLRKWRDTGVLPYLKLTSRSFRYPKKDIDDMIVKMCKGSSKNVLSEK